LSEEVVLSLKKSFEIDLVVLPAFAMAQPRWLPIGYPS
jgi:hypothetical protein